MTRLLPAWVVVAALALLPARVWADPPAPHGAQQPVHHELEITLHPEQHRLVAKDTITIGADRPTEMTFRLHRGLTPATSGTRLTARGGESMPVPLESFTVSLPPGERTFVIEYGGTIHHPVERSEGEQARGFTGTPGIISEEGVYLAASSVWYPQFGGAGDALVTFRLTASVPAGWDAVSQGARTRHARSGDGTTTRWEAARPQEEIYLVAGPFTEYAQRAGAVEALAMLRSPDESLARKYLDATASYLAMYETLIGPYPYDKFALVENFWETGLGMPSFTLLGPTVVRLPFILHSSYPHEILHNWWGNGVFTDLATGNWSEGLTAYLSDHLVQEQRGAGPAHRQAVLQKYADYVSSSRDFPLTAFRARHGAPSEAVGYGKSAMLFHMMRRRLGDDTFVAGLQDFYRNNAFRRASFDDVRRSFESVSGTKLRGQFDQWVTRAGAPSLRVGQARAQANGDGYVLAAVLEQTQDGLPYRLQIPIAVTVDGQEHAEQRVVTMETRRLELRLPLSARPLRLDVDPEYDLFRRLDRDEVPPALTQVFGSRRAVVLLPSSAEEAMLAAYRDLSEAIRRSGPEDVAVASDTEADELPADPAVILVGWGNRFLATMAAALAKYDVTVAPSGVMLGHTAIPRENHSLALTTRHPDNPTASLTWIASDRPDALPGLGRKLPHYHKYSYLAFEGAEPANVAKGRWPVVDSPMTVFVARDDGTTATVERGKLAARTPLARLPPVFSRERMAKTIRVLSNEELGGRAFGSAGLDRAAAFIAEAFREAGLTPGGDADGGYFQIWQDRGGDPERSVTLKNVVGVIPGRAAEYAGQSVVVAAHYDHLGLGWPEAREERHRGKIHPGADDNASGVAVLLELARVLRAGGAPDRAIVFAAFSAEEAGRRGSIHYVANEKTYPAQRCIGMINLDTVGRLENGRLLVLGAASAREWVHIFRGAGYVTGVDVQVASEPLDASDHTSFHEAGIPAVQLFSGPHLDYHRPSDTADKIDAAGLVKVAAVAKEAIEHLASRREYLAAPQTAVAPDSAPAKTTRTVSLGTIPDFAFRGEGYRLSGVVPGSPAASAGLRTGDVILRIGADPVRDLRDLSRILKSLSPGDTVVIGFLREGRQETVAADLLQR